MIKSVKLLKKQLKCVLEEFVNQHEHKWDNDISNYKLYLKEKYNHITSFDFIETAIIQSNFRKLSFRIKDQISERESDYVE